MVVRSGVLRVVCFRGTVDIMCPPKTPGRKDHECQVDESVSTYIEREAITSGTDEHTTEAHAKDNVLTLSLMCPQKVPGEILSIENMKPSAYRARSDDPRTPQQHMP